MRRKRHTSEQIIRKLREVEAMEASGQTIRQPTIMGSVRADGQSEAAITRQVPDVAAGRYIYFQAIDPATCRVSNRILRLF